VAPLGKVADAVGVTLTENDDVGAARGINVPIDTGVVAVVVAVVAVVVEDVVAGGVTVTGTDLMIMVAIPGP
jgi:hypothetical protein